MLDSAYRCFCRNGFRRTTITDIVEAAELSRPTVYKYVGSKDAAFAKVIQFRLEQALAAATTAASSAHTPEEQVLGVLTVKLEVAIRLWRDSPSHAQELLSAASVQTPELLTAYMDGLSELLTSALSGAIPGNAKQVASVLLTFTRGLEDDLRDGGAARRELRTGVALITGGALTRLIHQPA